MEELRNLKIFFGEATLSWFKKVYFLINVFRKITRPGGSLPFTTELKLTDQIFLLKSFRFVRLLGSMIQDNLAAPKAENLTVKTFFFFKVISVSFS